MSMSASAPTIVIGAGTGRCGTHSLAAFIQQQNGAVARHERRPVLPWRHPHLWPSDRDVLTAYDRLGPIIDEGQKLTGRSNPVIAEVAFFNLTWVLAFLHATRMHNATFAGVLLWRGPIDICDSFAKHLPSGNASPEFRTAYPDRGENGKAEPGKRRYCMDYVRVCHQYTNDIMETYPHVFRQWETDALSNPWQLKAIARWCGINAPPNLTVRRESPTSRANA